MKNLDATARFNAACLARAAMHGGAAFGFFAISKLFVDASCRVIDGSPAGNAAMMGSVIAGATALTAIAGMGENMRLIADRRAMTADP